MLRKPDLKISGICKCKYNILITHRCNIDLGFYYYGYISGRSLILYQKSWVGTP